MQSLIVEVFKPREDGTLSFHEQTNGYLRIMEANAIQSVLELSYNFGDRCYSLRPIDIKGSVSAYLSKRLNAHDLVVLLAHDVRLTSEEILELDFQAVEDKADDLVIPEELFSSSFELDLMAILSSSGCKTACYAFHDLQSLVVWHVVDHLSD